MNCSLCGGETIFHLRKKGVDGNEYTIHRCVQCTVWQIYPLPSADALTMLYQSDYFKKRSDRGYADYTSEKIYRSIVSTLEKNLHDLDFFSWEKKLPRDRALLEVGCASGHALAFFAARGWQTLGMDIAREMIDAGKSIGRNLICADFLSYDFEATKFDLITHWATLEHLPQPQLFLQKMATLLTDEGRLYLSTCNTGYFARRYGRAWRYLNLPEHVFYFNKKSLSHLASQCGLRITRAFSYGSGFTTKDDAGIFYRLKKRIADCCARYFLSGDMIVIEMQLVSRYAQSQ